MDADLGALAARLDSMAEGLQDPYLRERVMNPIGRKAVKIHREEVVAVLGGSRRFSGWRRAGVLIVRFKHTGAGRIVIAPPPKNTGPNVVLTSGRRGGRQGRTAGHGTYDRAVQRISNEAPQEGFDALTKDMVKRFGY